MAQRKLFTLELATNLVLLVYRVVCMDVIDHEPVAVLVERQVGNDTVHFSSAHNVVSCITDDKVTYLVDDKMCVSNQELLKGNHYCQYIIHLHTITRMHRSLAVCGSCMYMWIRTMHDC